MHFTLPPFCCFVLYKVQSITLKRVAYFSSKLFIDAQNIRIVLQYAGSGASIRRTSLVRIAAMLVLFRGVAYNGMMFILFSERLSSS